MVQKLEIRTARFPLKPAGIVVVYVAAGTQPVGMAAKIWAAIGRNFVDLAEAAGFSGKQGQVLLAFAPEGFEAKRLMVLGSGNAEPQLSAAAWADRGGSLMAKLPTDAQSVAVMLDEPDATPAMIAELAAGIRLRLYKFDRYKSRKADDITPENLLVTLYVADPEAVNAAIARRMAVAEGTVLARDLINEPANILGTEEFAARAQELSALGIDVQILGRSELIAEGANALLAVAQGSARPPRLVSMHWNGNRSQQAPIAIVGKGVVFDSGGISIKPAANMEDMKGDMGGAAAVVGLMHTLATRKAKVNVVGIIGLVENMPSGTAMRPGDIVRAMSGTTIEIVNTDAEGRLVLADALWYAQKKFKPHALIDLATLTGAVIVALGADHAGLFSNNDDLAAKLVSAGLVTGEKLWRLPLGSAYDKLIDSRFADIKNSAGRPAGAITAAQFLARFVTDVPWAHIDIAGVSLAPPASETNTSWAPGFGVALLEKFLCENFEGK